MLRRIGRLLLIAITVEALTIVVLVVLVAMLGPSDPDAAQAYAERLGFWVGPIAGFILCLGGGWLAATGLETHHVRNGLALGLIVAAIDIGLLIAGGPEFHPVFVISNIGRVIAGSLGGWLAGRARNGPS